MLTILYRRFGHDGALVETVDSTYAGDYAWVRTFSFVPSWGVVRVHADADSVYVDHHPLTPQEVRGLLPVRAIEGEVTDDEPNKITWAEVKALRKQLRDKRDDLRATLEDIEAHLDALPHSREDFADMDAFDLAGEWEAAEETLEDLDV